MTPVPNDVPQVRLRHDRVSYGDLCHYGWNVWNAFKGATNRFYDQTELAEWLKASFESLAKYNTKTLRAKLRATDGGYRIRLLDNLKEYIQNKELYKYEIFPASGRCREFSFCCHAIAKCW